MRKKQATRLTPQPREAGWHSPKEWMDRAKKDGSIIRMEMQSLLTEDEITALIRYHLAAMGQLTLGATTSEIAHKVNALAERIRFLSSLTLHSKSKAREV